MWPRSPPLLTDDAVYDSAQFTPATAPTQR